MCAFVLVLVLHCLLHPGPGLVFSFLFCFAHGFLVVHPVAFVFLALDCVSVVFLARFVFCFVFLRVCIG